MGYYTTFEGELTFDRPLDERMAQFVRTFAKTRHVVRDPKKVAEMLAKTGMSMNELLPPIPGITDAGPECMLLAARQNSIFNPIGDPSVLDYNTPPGTCPDIWCDIELSEDNTALTLLDGKNYMYVKWLQWLIDNIFAPANYSLNGRIDWNGEERGDIGSIVVKDNEVFVDNT